jgi:hypothetical protein
MTGLVVLAMQAAVFYSRSADAPTGWRRYVPATLVLAALAAAAVSALWLTPQTVVAYATAGSQAHARILIPVRGMVMLGVEAFLVLAALVSGFMDSKR